MNYTQIKYKYVNNSRDRKLYETSVLRYYNMDTGEELPNHISMIMEFNLHIATEDFALLLETISSGSKRAEPLPENEGDNPLKSSFFISFLAKGTPIVPVECLLFRGKVALEEVSWVESMGLKTSIQIEESTYNLVGMDVNVTAEDDKFGRLCRREYSKRNNTIDMVYVSEESPNDRVIMRAKLIACQKDAEPNHFQTLVKRLQECQKDARYILRVAKKYVSFETFARSPFELPKESQEAYSSVVKDRIKAKESEVRSAKSNQGHAETVLEINTLEIRGQQNLFARMLANRRRQLRIHAIREKALLSRNRELEEQVANLKSQLNPN